LSVWVSICAISVVMEHCYDETRNPEISRVILGMFTYVESLGHAPGRSWMAWRMHLTRFSSRSGFKTTSLMPAIAARAEMFPSG